MCMYFVYMYIYQLHIPPLGTKEEMELLEEKFLRKQYHPDSAAAEKEQENCLPEVESCLEKGLALYMYVKCEYCHITAFVFMCTCNFTEPVDTSAVAQRRAKTKRGHFLFYAHVHYRSQAISSVKLHVFPV